MLADGVRRRGLVGRCARVRVEAIVSRLRQLEPEVLLATAAYEYNGRSIDRSDVAVEVVTGLPTLERIVWVGAPAQLRTSGTRTTGPRSCRKGGVDRRRG